VLACILSLACESKAAQQQLRERLLEDNARLKLSVMPNKLRIIARYSSILIIAASIYARWLGEGISCALPGINGLVVTALTPGRRFAGTVAATGHCNSFTHLAAP
jgi:hypothetical protein